MAAGAVIELDASDLVPTPSQQRFLDSRARIAAFVAGYGAGKTSTGAEKALDLIAANPGCNGMIVAPTYGQLEKAALRAFFDHEAPDAGACPKEWIAEVNIGKRYFLHPNGARTYWGSADSPRSLEGQNLAWFWLDEPGDCKLRSYQVLVGRLRDKRAKWVQGFVTGTPRPGWMWGEFNSGKAEQEVIHASTRENRAHLAPGTIENLERTYSAREARVLIDGEFGLLVGAVFEEFERKTHLVDWKYDPRFRTVCFIDFGYRRPYVGWAQQVPAGWKLAGVPVPMGGAWVVFDELVKDNVTTERLAGMIREKGYKSEVIYCDPAGDSTQSSTGISDIIVLKSTLGFDNVRWLTAPKYRHIPNGASILRGMLRNARGEIRLWFAKSLDRARDVRGILKSLEGYAYPEAKDGRPVGDEPVKDGLFDHACLLGSEQVLVEGHGWERLDQLDGARYTRILTPAGFADASVALTRRAARVFEVVLETGETIVATGDHRFVVVEPSCGGRSVAGLSWRSLLEMRALLLASDARWRAGVPASSGMVRLAGPNSEVVACASPRRGSLEQRGGEPGGEASDRAPVGAHDSGEARGLAGLHGQGRGSGEGLALLARWQGLAQQAWARIVGEARGDGLYLPRVWGALQVVGGPREVLPPELQNDCAAQAARHPAASRIIEIREVGVSDVWCAHVPSEHAFVLRSGVVSHNCDGVRYFATNLAASSGAALPGIPTL